MKSHIKPLALLCSALAVALAVSDAFADSEPVGTVFTFQGRLIFEDEPVNGQVDLDFRLFDSATNGTQIGLTQTATGVPVADGLFTVDIDFGPGMFTGAERWLEIDVNNVTLSPRQPVMPTPYAMVATTAANVPTKAVVGSYAGITGVGTLDSLSVSGNVGVGTSTPTSKLHVIGGDIRSASDIVADSIIRPGWGSTTSPTYRFGTGSEVTGLSSPVGNAISLITNSQERLRLTSAGRVGIGTNNPQSLLHLSSTDTHRLLMQSDVHVDLVLGRGDTTRFGNLMFADGNPALSSNWRWSIGLRGGNSDLHFRNEATASVAMRITQNGAIGIGIGGAAPQGQVEVQTSMSTGVFGATSHASGTGVFGLAPPGASSQGVYGWSPGGVGVRAAGNMVASGSKSFQIDHPLDPENRWLQHYCTESSEPMNFYSGNVILNDLGKASVELPEWFEAINRDYRYQLTPIGAPAPNLHIKERIAGNRFAIAGGAPGIEVSWRIEAVRDDLYVREYGAPIEIEKPEAARGKYLHPELYGEPPERGILFGAKPDIEHDAATVIDEQLRHDALSDEQDAQPVSDPVARRIANEEGTY